MYKYVDHLTMNIYNNLPLMFLLDTRDNEIRFIRTLLKDPAYFLKCCFMTQINYFAMRSSKIIPDGSFSTHDRYYRKIDITGIFHLLVAGADFIIDTYLFRYTLKCYEILKWCLKDNYTRE